MRRCSPRCGALAAAVTLKTPLIVLVGAVAGFVYGASRSRARLERTIAARAARIRLELYTVNHLLAMQVRTGSGAMQAVQRVVERGRGAVVEELRDVLDVDAQRARRGRSVPPRGGAHAGAERGAHVSTARRGRRAGRRSRRWAARAEQRHPRRAARADAQGRGARRAAMLVPTIAILAPIMLLFIAAPLPSIVLGHH